MTSKKDLSERDICTKYIQPALEKAGWNPLTQIREEVTFTDGRIYVKGNLTSRGKRKRADYILYHKPNIPIAIIEAKDNKHSMKNQTISDNNLRYIDSEMRKKIKPYVISKNDLYVVIVGATIGKCGVVPPKFDGMNLTENAAKIILTRH